MVKSVFFLAIFILLFEISMGYSLDTGVNGKIGINFVNPIPQINNNTFNVNNTACWLGHCSSDGSWLTGISTYNSTYDAKVSMNYTNLILGNQTNNYNLTINGTILQTLIPWIPNVCSGGGICGAQTTQANCVANGGPPFFCVWIAGITGAYFNISNSSSRQKVLIDGYGTYTGYNNISLQSENNNSYHSLSFYRTGSLKNGNVIGELDFFGGAGSGGATNILTGAIKSIANENSGSTPSHVGSNLSFYAGDSAGSINKIITLSGIDSTIRLHKDVYVETNFFTAGFSAINPAVDAFIGIGNDTLQVYFLNYNRLGGGITNTLSIKTGAGISALNGRFIFETPSRHNANIKSYYGDLDEASIYDDNTNLFVNPHETGSGYLAVLGSINFTGNLFSNNNDFNFNGTSHLLNLTGNISSSYYFGNGSLLTDVCLSNGNNCISIAGMNYTNLAMLNSSNDFGANNLSTTGIIKTMGFTINNNINGSGNIATTQNITSRNLNITGNVFVDGNITASAGSASAPSITFAGDTDTGFYSAGGNQAVFTSGGTRAVAMDWVSTSGGTSRFIGNGGLAFYSDTVGGVSTNTISLGYGSASNITLTTPIGGSVVINKTLAVYGNATIGQLLTLQPITLPSAGILTNGSIGRNSTDNCLYYGNGSGWSRMVC